MGNYNIPITYLINNISNIEIINPPKITNKTIELGNKFSPNFVCTPFKYTLGTLIESLDKGANVLLQMGGGCKYGYYSELQEEILKDLGYDFKLYNFVSAGKMNIKKIYKIIKEIDPKINLFKGLYYLLISIKMVKYMDLIDDYIRCNIGFEEEKGSFEKLHKECLNEFSKVKNIFSLYFCYKKYLSKFKKIKTNKPKNCLKVGIIGELYTLMEPFCNYNLERELAHFNIEIKRFTNVYYLLFEKKRKTKKALSKSKKYMKYKMEADSSMNVYWCEQLCKENYDGIIHIKSSFCTPEIGTMPIINKICNDYEVPLMYFSFDTNTSSVGLKTRIEAFVDMLEMRLK